MTADKTTDDKAAVKTSGAGSVDPGRLSLNTATIDPWNLEQCIDGCGRAGIGWIGPWRHKVAETGLEKAAARIRSAGLNVSSLCRGGMFPAATAAERRARIDDNKRAIDEAATLGTDVLVLVCGPPAGRDLDGSRRMVEDGIGELAPYARARGVILGIEPLHPVYCGDRSVIVTLAQALDIALRFPSAEVGVVVDVFHVWWDPELYRQLERAAGRIVGYHVNDWLVPLPDVLKGRGMMGDGAIELRRIRQAVEAAGYRGPIEVEIFNESIWSEPGDAVLQRMIGMFAEHV